MLLQKVGRNRFKHGVNLLSTSCIRLLLVTQTVILLARIVTTVCDLTSYRPRKLNSFALLASLTMQVVKPYHGLFEIYGI